MTIKLNTHKKMEITNIQIHPSTDQEDRVKATAEIVLNDTLTLRGLKILQGRYGLFLAFPVLQPGSPYRMFETLTMRFRMDLQNQVLKAYHKVMNSPMPLFG